MLFLDLFQAGSTLRLEHHDIHTAEAHLEGLTVLLVLVFLEFDELLAELLLDPNGDLLASMAIKDSEAAHSVWQVSTRDVGVLLGLAPALH